MIFTARSIQMTLLKPTNPIEEFITHDLLDKGERSYKRSHYFIRYIGYGQSKEQYIEKIRQLNISLSKQKSYLMLEKLNKQFPVQQTNRYIKIYEAWFKLREEKMEEIYKLPFPMHFQNEMMELTQKVAFGKVMDLFIQSNPSANDTMKRNFGVSILGLSDYYLPKLFGQGEIVCGKVIYIGEIKRQELLFLYYLNLLGVDILYINPEGDIKQKYPECEKISTLYRESNCAFIDLVEVLHTKKQSIGSNSQMTIQSSTNRPSTSATQSSMTSQSASMVQPSNNRQNTNTMQSQSTSRSGINLVRRSNEATKPHTMHINQVVASTLSGTGTTAIPSRELSYEELAKLSTAVVIIYVMDKTGRIQGNGSGVVINSEGYILTNHHVVDAGVRYAVRFENDDTVYETDRVIKYHREFDLAIIKVNKKVMPILVYEEKNIVRGQKVVAIGSPLGLFNSISEGIVSGFRIMQDGQRLIQFTAPISRGSSGGALLDLYGRLIGICSSGIDEGQNLNLAVDSECIGMFAHQYIHE